jgi:hypothetical protein
MRLGEGAGDGFFPAALRFEDKLDDFAGCSAAAGALCGVVADGFEFGCSVGDADGEAGALGEGHVGEIVTEIGYFVVGDAGFGEAFVVGLHLAGLTEIDEGDFEFFGALGDGGGTAAGDESGLNAHDVGEGEALAVLGVKDFHFGDGGGRVALGAGGADETDAAVGEGAVYVHEEDFDLAGAGLDFFGDVGEGGVGHVGMITRGRRGMQSVVSIQYSIPRWARMPFW